METATSLVITQFADYLRQLTQSLDPGAGWYGEFLRRDPEGVRACLDGVAMAPWDVVESLLGDLAAARGAEFVERETVYAARLRAAAVTAWDRLPGGVEELRTLLAASAAQRTAAEAALRALTARLGSATDPARGDALSRELSWTRDDAARAASRHSDLTARLAAVSPPGPPAPWPTGSPSPSGDAWPGSPVPGPAGRLSAGSPGAAGPLGGGDFGEAPSGAPWSGAARAEGGPEPAVGDGLPGVPRQRPPEADAPVGRAGGGAPVGWAGGEVPVGQAGGDGPVGRGGGRWLRGARRAGGARYAGSAAAEVPAFTPPPGAAKDSAPAPRGARFGRPRPEPETGGARHAPPHPEPREGATAGTTRDFVAGLLALRTQGRTGEAHAQLCEAAAWPAARLPGLAAELARAGLAADWATLLWEAAASLPPERLVAAAAALGEAGREADRDQLLRQGMARPAAEIAEAALALGEAGRTREAEVLLAAFVRVRTAEDAAALARRAPQWFVPRLLRAAGAHPGSRHRDLVHALRVAGLPTA